MYAQLCKLANLNVGKEGPAEALALHIEELIRSSGLPTSLDAFNVLKSQIPELAIEAADQWTGGFNPRALTVQDFKSLYYAAYDGEAS